jgi:protein O-GlcNAc transferase
MVGAADRVVSASDYCVLLPRLDFEKFSTAMGCCDIVLDSIGWSGCNSTLESLAHDLPIVTPAPSCAAVTA